MAPAGTINRLAEKEAQIAVVEQPLPSEQGTAAESVERFRVRVSERLRHKQRAIHPKDYESLVLENFPSINEAKGIGIDAGEVVVVVSPMRDAGHTETEPRVPEYTLREIAAYLRQHVSPWVERIRVRNPSYEHIRAMAWVEPTVALPLVVTAALQDGLHRGRPRYQMNWNGQILEKLSTTETQ